MKLSILDRIFKVSTLDILLFTKHLAVMLKSGIPISEAIDTLKNQQKNSTLKRILIEVGQEVDNGQSLADALAKHRETFNSLYISLIGIGEKSGNLESNLEYLSVELKKSYDFNKKVQGAILYPKIILAATALMGMFISLFVLPKLVDLFHSLDVKLPLSTKILLFIASLMKDYGVFIAVGLVVIAVSLTILLRTPFFKPKWHRVMLSLPIIGSINQNVELTSFCRNIGIMLKSGLTITNSLEVQLHATDNLVYKSYVSDFLREVEKGKKLSDVMGNGKYKYIPGIVPKMVGVGEATGKLEDVMIYLGDFFEEEVDDATKNISNTLEPILLLVIGLVVAFVALAIISPIYQLTGSIHK